MRPRAETRAVIVSSLHAATRAATAIRQTCGVDSDEYRDARRTLDRARKDFAAFVGAEREGGTDLLERRWKGHEARREMR